MLDRLDHLLNLLSHHRQPVVVCLAAALFAIAIAPGALRGPDPSPQHDADPGPVAQTPAQAGELAAQAREQEERKLAAARAARASERRTQAARERREEGTAEPEPPSQAAVPIGNSARAPSAPSGGGGGAGGGGEFGVEG